MSAKFSNNLENQASCGVWFADEVKDNAMRSLTFLPMWNQMRSKK